MTDPGLHERGEWVGQFWRAELPDERVPGILTYEPDDGVRLRLIGGWDYHFAQEVRPGVTAIAEGSRSWPLIHGLSGTRMLTLLGASVTSASSPLMRTPTEMVLRAETLLAGMWLDSPDEARFIGISATVESLTAWSNRSGIEAHFTIDEETRRRTGIEEVHVTPVDDLTVDLADGQAILHLRQAQTRIDRKRDRTSAEAIEWVSMEFTYEEAKPLEPLLERVSALSDLLSLSTYSAAGAMRIDAWLPPTPGRYAEQHPLHGKRETVAIYQRRLVVPDPNAALTNRGQFLLSLADIELDELLPRWLEVHDRFAPTVGMVLGLKYVTGGFIETRVTTAVGAAEAMHRALKTEPPIPPAEFRQLAKDLKNIAPKKWRPWVSTLVARNEPSLKQRLLDLAARPGSSVASIIPDTTSWAAATVKARNELAHEGVAKGHGLDVLHAVVEVTAAVVVLNLLHELGVPEERLLEVVDRHPSLRLAKRLGREYFPQTNAE